MIRTQVLVRVHRGKAELIRITVLQPENYAILVIREVIFEHWNDIVLRSLVHQLDICADSSGKTVCTNLPHSVLQEADGFIVGFDNLLFPYISQGYENDTTSLGVEKVVISRIFILRIEIGF
jgi:hypothetical protein